MSIKISFFEIYLRLFKKRPFLTTVLLVVYVVALTSFFELSRREKENGRNVNSREVVASKIIQAIDPAHTPESTAEKISVIFNAYDRQLKGELSEYGLVNLLEDVYAIHSEKPLSEELSSALIAQINKQKERDPYYGLRFEQQVIIRNLEENLKDSSSSENITFVEQIKEVVRRQNIEIDELKKSNSWGIPVGIAGVIFTIIFGIIGLVYPLTRKKRSQPVELQNNEG